MKQQGKDWITAEGKSTLAKFLPKEIVLHEKLGQKIAIEATDLEVRLREAKARFIDLAKEALRNNPDQSQETRFTFYTFDREYKIEFDIKIENVRVYRATKKAPSSKDYELIIMDLNKAATLAADHDPKYVGGGKRDAILIDEVALLPNTKNQTVEYYDKPTKEQFDDLVEKLQDDFSKETKASPDDREDESNVLKAKKTQALSPETQDNLAESAEQDGPKDND